MFSFSFLSFSFSETALLYSPHWGTVAQSWLTAALASLAQRSSASAPQVVGNTGTRHHTWLIFVFLLEIGFHHVGQAGLKPLTLGDLPTSTFQSAGITTVACTRQLLNNISYSWEVANSGLTQEINLEHLIRYEKKELSKATEYISRGHRKLQKRGPYGQRWTTRASNTLICHLCSFLRH